MSAPKRPRCILARKRNAPHARHERRCIGGEGCVTTSAVKPPPASTSPARIIAYGPLFGGYTVVAVVAAWLVGIALRAPATSCRHAPLRGPGSPSLAPVR